MKKGIIIILIIAIIGSLASLGYLFYQQKEMGPTNPPTNNSFPVVGEKNTVNPETEPASENSTNKQADVINAEQFKISGLSSLFLNKDKKTFFVEQSTGHLYVLDNQNNPQRLTNLTQPETIKIYWGYDPNSRYLLFQKIENNEVKGYLGKIKIPEDKDELWEIKTIPWLVKQSALAVSPTGNQIVYLIKKEDGGSTLYLNDWSLSKSTKLWESSLSDWLLDWPTIESMMISDRPTYDYPGTAYLFNLKTRELKKTISNIYGLIVKASPDGKKLIYSKSLLNGFSLYQYEIATGESRLIELKTLPDKCIWAKDDVLYCAIPKKIPAANYPDDWYQGKISFADDIWKIDLTKKTTQLLYQTKGAYDLIDLTINEETGWLYAVDKNTKILQTFSLIP